MIKQTYVPSDAKVRLEFRQKRHDSRTGYMKDSYPVTNEDVTRGFALDSKQVKEYSNMFTVWIIKNNP